MDSTQEKWEPKRVSQPAKRWTYLKIGRQFALAYVHTLISKWGIQLCFTLDFWRQFLSLLLDLKAKFSLVCSTMLVRVLLRSKLFCLNTATSADKDFHISFPFMGVIFEFKNKLREKRHRGQTAFKMKITSTVKMANRCIRGWISAVEVKQHMIHPVGRQSSTFRNEAEAWTDSKCKSAKHSSILGAPQILNPRQPPKAQMSLTPSVQFREELHKSEAMWRDWRLTCGQEV